jgi:hypothetical protein
MRTKPRFGRKRRVNGRPLEANQVDVGAVDGGRQRVVLHARASAEIPEHNNRGSHVI